MRLFLVLCIFLVCQPSFASEDWGRTGHRATGEIAEQHLSRKAKRKIMKLLNGQSLAFVSTYGDEIRSDTIYRPYGPWHYVNFPLGARYETHPKSDRGDLIRGIETCVNILRDDTTSEADKIFHLKMLVHFVGDLHQPLHIGKEDDSGGNDFEVQWFGEGTNLHTVWDTKMIESYNMSYSELAANADALSPAQIEQLKQGTILDWMYESRAILEDVYANTQIGDQLGYRYMYDYFTTVRSQLQKGGIRLAHMLNEIFG